MEFNLKVELPVRVKVLSYFPAEEPDEYSPGSDEEIEYELKLVDKQGKGYDVILPSGIESYIKEQLDEKVSDLLYGEFADQEIEHKLAMSA